VQMVLSLKKGIKMKRLWIFIVMCLFMAINPFIVTATAIRKAVFETVDKGFFSHYEGDDKQQIIEIYNKKEWKDFWEQHTKGIYPPPPLPIIDFTKYYVIVAMDEIRSRGGYALQIKEVKVDSSIENRPFDIIIQLIQPGSAVGTTAVITRPYHIIKVRK